MKVKVKGGLRDLLAFRGLPKQRRKRIAQASDEARGPDSMNVLAARMHPDRLFLAIREVREETPDVRTFKLGADPDHPGQSMPFFRAGQYISVIQSVNGVTAARPYSLSSSPEEALEIGYLEITIQKRLQGFLTAHIWDQWNVGRKIEATGPHGFFYHDPLRDSNRLLALAGGCGVTPFRSMVKDFIQRNQDVEMTLLYGVRTEADVVFAREWEAFEDRSGGRFKMVTVCSEPDPAWDGPQGFLTSELIRKHVGDLSGVTVFVCGPQVMYQFLESELAQLDLPRRRIRREAFGQLADVSALPGFPKDTAAKTFSLKVQMADQSVLVPARGDETVLVAMERARLAPPSACRSGECGYCRAQLLSGDVYVRPEGDWRRAADRKYGGFHPCSSYPVSDLEIKVPRRPGH